MFLSRLTDLITRKMKWGGSAIEFFFSLLTIALFGKEYLFVLAGGREGNEISLLSVNVCSWFYKRKEAFLKGLCVLTSLFSLDCFTMLIARAFL